MFPAIYITDCFDDNTKARQAARIQSLVPNVSSVNFVGVRSTLEAAGNLVDTLDALENRVGLVFVNVAPRGTGRHPNGTPFGYFHYNNANIFTTVEGETFSLLQKLTGKKIEIQEYNIPEVVALMVEDPATQAHIVNSQFRSFDFLPRLTAKVLEGTTLPHTLYTPTAACPNAVWWQDNFGNFKTTLLPEDAEFKPGQVTTLVIDQITYTLPCYSRLKDIPQGELGLYVGSSGLPNRRLLEITKQKGDALVREHTASLPIAVGDEITLVK